MLSPVQPHGLTVAHNPLSVSFSGKNTGGLPFLPQGILIEPQLLNWPVNSYHCTTQGGPLEYNYNFTLNLMYSTLHSYLSLFML